MSTIGRREFLWTAAAAAVSGAAASSQRIVVVGAGLAGLRFAHAMWVQHGVAVTVYEANTRLGGRVWTNRGFFADGQIAEHGAEFISTEHASMRRLAKRFGLRLDVVNGGSNSAGADVGWFDGAYYRMGQINADLSKLQPKIDAAYNSAPFPQTYNNHTAAAFTLDNTPANVWIDNNVEGGSASRLGRLLLTVLLAEYGCEPSQQSALNLIYLLGGNGPGGLAGTDEKYHVHGGNDQIPAMLASALPAGAIVTDAALVALKQNSDQRYTCTFSQGARVFDVSADHVVLALPFNKLKLVELSKANFSTVKMMAIDKYALGTNCKLPAQFNSRPWANPDGWSGVAYTAPDNIQETWEVTVAQKGAAGILVDYLAGDAGGLNAFPGSPPHGPAPANAVAKFLDTVDGPFPGTKAAYNGQAYLDWWATDPFIGGAYGCYQAGQITAFAGIEALRDGNVHFCGEQTSLNFQGYMEGAVESAERLANRWPIL